MKKKELVNFVGILGVISFVSYVLAVVLSPLKYPGYNWMAQAVSDLSCESAPSRTLWNQLAAPYNICGIVMISVLCLYVKGKLNRLFRLGIYLFTAMSYVSAIGYRCFPLTQSDGGGTFQDVMHLVVTGIVVALTIASLVILAIGCFKKKTCVSLGVLSLIALGLTALSSVSGAVPHAYFGIFERFATLSITGFTAVLGIYLFFDFFQKEPCVEMSVEEVG